MYLQTKLIYTTILHTAVLKLLPHPTVEIAITIFF
jgi:hypothetical protein